MNQPATRSTNGRAANGGRAAALHRQGGMWRLVVLESSGSGARLIEARTLAVGDAATVRSALAHHGVDRLIRVLPASSTVCRVVETPEGDQSEVAAALALIGEASLPANLPAHRRAAAPLAGINGHISPRAALILGWSGAVSEPPIGGVAESWTAEPAALLWLMRLRCRAALFADRATGSISAYAAGPQRLIVRALREKHEGLDQWRRTIDTCFDQTLAGAGLTAPATRLSSGDTEVRVDCGESTLFEGIMPSGPPGSGDEWAAEYGVAVAAAFGALVAPESMRPLFSLTADAVREHEPRVVRWLNRLSSPARARWIIGAALGVALLGPLALAAARHAILNAKSGGLATQQEIDRKDALLEAFHDELGKRRWPMTGLLADLSGSLPIGVSIESIRLETGQRVGLRGSAESLELVNQLQSKLNGTGVFAEVAIDRTQGGESGQVEFDLSARVVRPYSDAKGIEDFTTQTLSQRLYGSDSTNPDREGGVSDDVEPTTRATDSGSVESASSASRNRSSRPAAKPAEIPEPITDEDIAKLDASAAMKQWTSRQKASKQTGIDAAARDRLKAEAEKCRARMQAARKEASR